MEEPDLELVYLCCLLTCILMYMFAIMHSSLCITFCHVSFPSRTLLNISHHKCGLESMSGLNLCINKVYQGQDFIPYVFFYPQTGNFIISFEEITVNKTYEYYFISRLGNFSSTWRREIRSISNYILSTITTHLADQRGLDSFLFTYNSFLLI